MNKNLLEYIFEIRYHSNFLILDNKGLILKELVDEFKFERYSNGNNGISVSKTDNTINAVFTHDRLGITLRGDNTLEVFKSYISKFLDIVFNIDVFIETINVLRIGARIRTYCNHESSFNDLKELYLKNYVTINPSLESEMGIPLIDFGYPLDYKDDDLFVKTNSGPMKSIQAINMFREYPEDDLLPSDIGIYIDVDSFVTPKKKIDFENISESISNLINTSKEKSEIIEKVIKGET